ncbi:hypothetical protein [Tissierella praeacuta]|uniref:Uncharacterized protein n=1 Tax=Tissierella praeacuta DSM 18095 TaxID=1123404 RepID=A0A1M4V1K6_9FIRM|nr:hypothetical protein [Tissierella praeacuta]HAE91182.1 hypothetical protein [Tissierella sp.]MBU5255125.1 hypothetical protein [Tissierella praeacuta]TCU74029.1 hypothetical protein EV204_10461 [Tissierella praeacuta]SHE62782.1 hypothetical protein SAMN02745784_01299 [Tissierella praeacuta DSM 18095]SUP02780.1 Uncharacterised protein [Tissierella praeacuta]
MLNNLLGCDDNNNMILIIILILLLLGNDDCGCDHDPCGGHGGIFGGGNIIWILILLFLLGDIF